VLVSLYECFLNDAGDSDVDPDENGSYEEKDAGEKQDELFQLYSYEKNTHQNFWTIKSNCGHSLFYKYIVMDIFT